MDIVKKQYKYLYAECIKEETIRRAYKKLRKGKTNRKEIKYIDAHLDEEVEKMRIMLINTKPCEVENPELAFVPPEHTSKVIVEYGKARDIIVPTITEQWVHHIIMYVLAPILMKRTFEHSFGSIPGRGLHKGKKVFDRFERNYRYVLKIDIRHFFQSVRLDILIDKLREFVLDEWFLYLVRLCYGEYKGLVLGFYPSQWYGNFFLDTIDLLIQKFAEHIRYMDDIVIGGNNKLYLHRVLVIIKMELGSIHLRLKDNYQIYDMTLETISFMGFRFKQSVVVLRKKILKHIRHNVRLIYKAKKDGRVIWNRLARRFMSYKGWLKVCDSHNLIEWEIKPFINVAQLQHIISKDDKRRLEYDSICTRSFRPRTTRAYA